MSQQQSFGSTGSTGSGIVSLAPNNGAPVSGTSVPVVGMLSKTSQVIDTANVGGELQIENRALMTRYVVIDSDVPGERGTYETIQDAVDAAIADGCTVGNQKCGLIYCIGALAGFTIGNDADPAFLTIRGVSNSGRDNSLLTGTTINSTVTINGGAINLEDLTFFVTSGDALAVDSAPASLSINQCSMYSTVAYGINYSADTTPLKISNCQFPGTARFHNPSTTGYGYIFNSTFQGSVLLEDAAYIEFEYCDFEAPIQMNGISTCDIFDCSSNAQFLIAGTSTTAAIACRVNNLWIPLASSAPVFNFPGAVIIGNIYYQSPQLGTSRELTNGTTQVIMNQQLKGNITTSKTVTGNANAFNYDTFVWCNHTAPMTFNLSPGAANNQEITIKDLSLNASTNNITLQVSGGLVEGAATYVMNQNGQCVRLKKLGTDYYLI